MGEKGKGGKGKKGGREEGEEGRKGEGEIRIKKVREKFKTFMEFIVVLRH